MDRQKDNVGRALRMSRRTMSDRLLSSRVDTISPLELITIQYMSCDCHVWVSAGLRVCSMTFPCPTSHGATIFQSSLQTHISINEPGTEQLSIHYYTGGNKTKNESVGSTGMSSAGYKVEYVNHASTAHEICGACTPRKGTYITRSI